MLPNYKLKEKIVADNNKQEATNSKQQTANSKICNTHKKVIKTLEGSYGMNTAQKNQKKIKLKHQTSKTKKDK